MGAEETYRYPNHEQPVLNPAFCQSLHAQRGQDGEEIRLLRQRPRHLFLLRLQSELRSCPAWVAVTPRHHRVAATPRRPFSDAGRAAAPTGDEGVASTFLRRGVAATRRPASEFGFSVFQPANQCSSAVQTSRGDARPTFRVVCVFRGWNSPHSGPLLVGIVFSVTPLIRSVLFHRVASCVFSGRNLALSAFFL